MNLDQIKSSLKGEPNFRFRQAWKAIFVDLISDWTENTTLPIAMREKLNQECPLNIEGKIFDSAKSEAIKALLTLEDGAEIETVLLSHNDGRKTVCLSSQVGCPMACKFCATGKMGYKRNLTVSEIVAQVLFFARYLNNVKQKNNRITNIVFMGMGEPFLNYDNVMAAIKIINDKEAFNIGARHISISTCGIIEGINKFAKEDMQINLAISLHAPNDELRSKIMPINKKYPLAELMMAVKNYIDKRGRQVMFEYLMIDGVNDSEVHANELAKLIEPLCIVNLIRYNPTGMFRPSNPQKIKKFKNILMRAGLKVTERFSFGTDIKAACGQLAGGK